MSDAKNYPRAGLYDIDVLRTIFLDFATDDWEAEMADFYHTDVEVPAKMTVDRKTYRDVGVGFRGNSSYFTVAPGHKRSLSISIDAKDKNQNLYGYRKLNLLNSHADPSFLRETLFSFVAGHYMPTYKVNLVKVVVNGRSWGVFVNSQQFNKDFTRDYFDTRKGVRWKIPPGRGAGSLVYLGDDKSAYESGFQLKSGDVRDEAWSHLIELCERLEQTPVEKIDTELDDILNIDRALWFLALDNVFIDGGLPLRKTNTVGMDCTP